MTRRWAAMLVLGAMLGACGGGSGAGGGTDAGVELLFPDISDDGGLDLPPADPGASDPGVDPDVPDVPCDEGVRRCDGADGVATCQAGAWITEACSTVCALKGADSLGCVDAECTCTDPQTGCDEGDTTCQGADTRALCVGGAWKTSVCSVVCANEGQASLGCVDGECACGTPPQCEPGETRCQGTNTVAICTDGQWVPTSCVTQCAESGLSSAGCVDEACACTDSPPECDEGDKACDTAEIYAQFVDGHWKATPCVEVCDAQGKDSHGCLGQSCQCVDKPLCYQGDTECVAATTLATCNGASWNLAACADVCAAKDMVGDQCTDGACACTPAPDCAGSETACDGATLLTCVDDAWTSTPCAGACGQLGLVGGLCSAGACQCLGDQDPACAGCLSGLCATQAQACRSSTPCSALSACLTACTDAACENACWTAHPTGVPWLSALLDCVASACPVACPDLPACLPGQQRCASSNASASCQGGSWQVTNCSESCYAQGLKSNGCAGGACSCVYEPFVCEHGTTGCPTAQTAAACEYGQWGPQTSCPSYCQASGQVSTGCSAGGCQCEGPCTLGQKRCQDAATLESCDVPPTWSSHNCESECTLKGLYSQGCGQVGGTADCLCLDDCGQCQYQVCPTERAACDATNCLAWDLCDWDCFWIYWSCTSSEYAYGCDIDLANCQAACNATYPGGADAYLAISPCLNTCQIPCSN